MTITKAHSIFEKLVSKTTKKSELKVYTKFLHILSKLKTRNFSEEETLAIETELDSLALESNPRNRKRQYTKALSKFETYLKDTFSLTTSGYYTRLGMALGMCFGVAGGSLIDRTMGVSSGLALGMLIGLCIGRHMDSLAKVAGNKL
ncbi:MAG: hypothetical protein ACI80H_000749 [Pseudoalteromonas distincta]|jgi:hypothetical protein